MGKQRNMPQIKEQNKLPENKLNKMDTSNLSDIECQAIVTRMKNSREKDIETIKKDKSEMNDIVSAMKNTL